MQPEFTLTNDALSKIQNDYFNAIKPFSMKRKKISNAMEFMSTLNEVANSCAPKKDMVDAELAPPTKNNASSSNEVETRDDSTKADELQEVIATPQPDSVQESFIEGTTSVDKIEEDKTDGPYAEYDKEHLDQSQTVNEPTAQKRTYNKRPHKKRGNKKQTESTSKKSTPLQTMEEIENLTIFQRIKRVSAQTAKCSLFTTVWVLKEKLDKLKILYPKKGIMYILDDIITDHLIKNKAKLQAEYQKQMDSLR